MTEKGCDGNQKNILGCQVKILDSLAFFQYNPCVSKRESGFTMAGTEFENRIRLGSLYSVYGQLLTTKQRRCTELYFYDDLSLAEIAAGMQISRQAVSDLLKRVEQILEHYEAQLGFLQKAQESAEVVASAKKLVTTAVATGSVQDLQQVNRLLDKLINEGR